MQEVIAELVKILPENQWLRLVLLMFVVMLVVLREKLFIGALASVRYLYRWVRCQVFGRHFWLMQSGYLDLGNMNYGTFNYRCDICGKRDVGPGVL